MSGGAVAFPWAAEHLNAILQAWYPGQAGGTAVADTLLGLANPAGRLPVTFYRGTSDLPPFSDYRMTGRTYRYFRGPVLYPFGYGLSYTTFAYKNLRTVTTKPLTVTLDVTNTGTCSGDEVVQLYVTEPDSSHPRARVSLCGFKRVSLAAGETKSVTVMIPETALRRWNIDQNKYVMPGGTWTIHAGASSADFRQTVLVPFD